MQTSTTYNNLYLYQGTDLNHKPRSSWAQRGWVGGGLLLSKFQLNHFSHINPKVVVLHWMISQSTNFKNMKHFNEPFF